MPKDNSERIIDWPYSNPSARAGAVSVSGPGGAPATNLDALTDVTVASPLNGQVLVYNSGSGQWVNATNPAGVPNPHGLSSVYHNGLLNWSLINFAGSSLGDIATRSHNLLTGIGPNDHHNQAHVLATGTALGPDHTISGANVGEVLRALSATTAAFDQLNHTDLNPSSITPDQHHAQVHNIVGTDHTVTGADFTVVGVHPTNTLGLLTATPAPGAAAAILRTDANGGIQLDTNLLYVDGANNWIGVNRTPSGATLDVIAASNADHTQRIKMKSGQTGRLWRIEDLSGNELIVLDSVGNLQSGQPGFVSGLTGWRISPQGNAEFNNIWARGELHATVFVKDEVHATGGTLLVATAGVLHDDAIINSTLVDDDVLVIDSTAAGHLVPLEVVTTSGAFTGNQLHVSWIGNIININDPPSGPGFYFQPGDVVRSKTEVPTGVTDFWFTVNSATQNTGYSTYSVTKQSGTDGTLPKGSAVVSYGKQGDGRILLTSDLNYGPYLDVFTTGYQVWTGNAGSIIPRVRLGRLDGVGLPGISGVEQYGMVASKDLSDANSGYFIASNLQLALYKVDLRLNNGVSDTGLWTADGNLRIGSNIGADATTGFRVYTTSGGGHNPGDVVIGNETTGNYLRWNQGSGVLQVVGSLVVSDPGTTVTKTYVDNQDGSYDLLAQGYGSTAQGNAQNYSDARRIVGVNAVFTSASATTIAWASFTAMMANGGARTIAAGSATLSARTFLYVNITLAGTLTLTPTTNVTILTSPNVILIAVADPATNGSASASVTVVVGSTYISGGNIFTGSITASSIASRTITADRILGGQLTLFEMAPDVTGAISGAQTAAQAYSDKYKLQGIGGSMTVTGQRSIAWSGLTLNYADGTTVNITNGSLAGMGGTAPATLRTYIYNNYGSAGLLSNTSLSVLTTTSSLIAVFDPGATTTDPGSLSIVGGATYISGNNIVTGSIVTGNIKSGAIDASVVDSSVYIAAGGYRATAVSDSFSIAGATPKVVSWTSLVVRKANGTSVNITNGSLDMSGVAVGQLFYLYIPGTATGTATMTPTSDITTMPAGAILIVLIEAGVNAASYRVVGGGTLITGDQIVTGSIRAQQLSVNNLSAINGSFAGVSTGDLNVTGHLVMGNTAGSTGLLYSIGKIAYGNTTPGFFLGWDVGAPTASFKLDIGDQFNYIRWNSQRLFIHSSWPIDMVTDNIGQYITLTSNYVPASPRAGVMTFDQFGDNSFKFDHNVTSTQGLYGATLDVTGQVTISSPTSNFTAIGFGAAGHSEAFSYDSTGLLTYSQDLSVGRTLLVSNAIILNNSLLRIHTPSAINFTGSTTSPPGTVGDIVWQSGFLYVYVGGSNGWRRATLNSF